MENSASRRQRAAILLFTLVVHVLVFVLLLLQAPWQPPAKDERRLVVFQIPPETPTKDHPVKHSVAGGKARPVPVPRPPEAPPPPIPEPPTPNPPLLLLNKDAFAATDIGKMGKRQSGAAAGSGPVYGPGEGLGGTQLVMAQWYRKPTDAELATYLPAGAASGFGTIECKTAPNYHVENCRVIDQTPGMGLGQAVRRAAWQFLVQPPRVNGQPQIGVSVAIRIDYTRVIVGSGRSGSSIPYPLPPPDKPDE